MKKYSVLFFSLILAVTFSCQKNSSDPGDDLSALEKENIEAIESILADSTDLSFDGIEDQSEDYFGVDDPSWLGGTALEKTAKKKTRFGRIRRRPVERSIQVVLDTDTTATAYMYTKVKGLFVVHKVEADTGWFNYDRYEKPMVHEIERVIHLKKIDSTAYPRKNWKIVDVSMKDGESERNSVQIVQLDIVPAGMDSVIITDPLSYFQDRRSLFAYKRGTEVKLRVTVKNTHTNPVVFPEGTEATENVRLHYGRNQMGHFARRPFTWIRKDNEGNNVYEGIWTIKQFPGVHHAVIDIIDNGTILSEDKNEYPYNSNTWATPYRVLHM